MGVSEARQQQKGFWHAVKCISAWEVIGLVWMFIVLGVQTPSHGSIGVLLVPIVVSPIGACCQMVLYSFVARKRAFTPFDGALAGVLVAACVFAILLANREPFLGFVLAYLIPSCVVVGVLCSISVYPESRALAGRWLRRAFTGPLEKDVPAKSDNAL